jgi:hypothetical protein
VGKTDRGSMHGAAGGHGGKQREQAQPRVRPADQAGSAQGKDCAAGYDQHRIEDHWVDLGQRGGDAGLTGQGVDT